MNSTVEIIKTLVITSYSIHYTKLYDYDSFTYNLVHYIQQLTNDRVDVYRNDQIALDEVGRYDKILLSPGPGVPSEAGICLDLIRRYAPSKSILGVCLGHQAIGEAFGGNLINSYNFV